MLECGNDQHKQLCSLKRGHPVSCNILIFISDINEIWYIIIGKQFVITLIRIYGPPIEKEISTHLSSTLFAFDKMSTFPKAVLASQESLLLSWPRSRRSEFDSSSGKRFVFAAVVLGPPNLPSSGYQGLFQGREADESVIFCQSQKYVGLFLHSHLKHLRGAMLKRRDCFWNSPIFE